MKPVYFRDTRALLYGCLALTSCANVDGPFEPKTGSFIPRRIEITAPPANERTITRAVNRKTRATSSATFVREQLRFTRVRKARNAAEPAVERLLRERKIENPAAIYIRVFKADRTLELWARSADDPQFSLLRTYPICALAGLLGPKQVQGDRQVPEGFYSIDLFNPNSAYHLSLRINYPNQRDRASAKPGRRLGGDIFIHGGCKSDGCLAITDEAIAELYWIALLARGWGQQRIPVHIFPARFDTQSDRLKRTYYDASLMEFWNSLRPVYDSFEQTRRLPQVGI
jgi:murein L,D-transpeptidase YafK